MRRSRFKLGCLTGAVIALGAGWACIPHPGADFEDYQERIANVPKPTIEASTFEASTPVDAVEGLYYGACLTELAFQNTNRVFNFYTLTKFTPAAAGGKLELSIQALKVLDGSAPPETVTKAGAVGEPFPGVADVDAESRYLIQLGTVAFPGSANPISGSDVVIEGATFQGRFGAERFCGRLGGFVSKPEAASRNLDPTQNICQFVPIKDGDPTPRFTLADFQEASCPVE